MTKSVLSPLWGVAWLDGSVKKTLAWSEHAQGHVVAEDRLAGLERQKRRRALTPALDSQLGLLGSPPDPVGRFTMREGPSG